MLHLLLSRSRVPRNRVEVRLLGYGTELTGKVKREFPVFSPASFRNATIRGGAVAVG